MSKYLPFAYPGQKGTWSARNHHRFPPHKTFVDPFHGSAAFLFLTPRQAKIEAMNDLNRDVHLTMAMLRDRPEELIARCQATEYGEAGYYLAWDILHSDERHVIDDHTGEVYDSDDPLVRAWAFLVVAHQGHVGHDPHTTHRSTFGFCVNSPGQPQGWKRIEEVLAACARRVREVQLFNRPYQWVLERFDGPETLFALDPPYHPDTLPASSKTFYLHRHIDHEDFLNRVLALQGKWMLFHNDCELYRRKLVGVRCEPTGTAGGMQKVRLGQKRRKKDVERVWMNF